MKGFTAAALLAAALVPAIAGAQPIGSEAACGVGMLGGQGEDSCRFVASADTLGIAGFTDTGWSLTHKEKTSACVNNVIVHTTQTVTDFEGTTGPVAEQTALVAGTVYTLSIEGNGGIMAGGPSGGAPSPTAEHPADAVVDKTGGTTAGAVCS
jgi:hypothetical protein